MEATSTVYIDEAGDLGIKRGTKWFILSAVIVDKDKESGIRKELKKIKENFNLNEVHLRKVPDYYKRAFIVKSVSACDFKIISIVIDTDKLNLLKFPNSTFTYNFACRLLIERISWFLRDEKKRADIVLSARGTSRDNELIRYIKEKLIPYEFNQVANVFCNVTAKTAASWDLLQLADISATTLFLAYEINHLGFRTPCFIKMLSTKYYRHNGHLHKYGLKYFSTDMQLSTEKLNENIICKST